MLNAALPTSVDKPPPNAPTPLPCATATPRVPRANANVFGPPAEAKSKLPTDWAVLNWVPVFPRPLAIAPSNIPLALAVVVVLGPSAIAKLVGLLKQSALLPTPLIDAQVALAVPVGYSPGLPRRGLGYHSATTAALLRSHVQGGGEPSLVQIVCGAWLSVSLCIPPLPIPDQQPT
jgi:hypothetical protein